MKNLVKALLEVSKECKTIEKNLNVGTGNSSYKGVSDVDVKQTIGQSMTKHGLCIIPTKVEDSLDVKRFEENGKYGLKHKMQVFVTVKVTYTILHESGESMEAVGYGHGTDTADKAAGKATTYALKYLLIYLTKVAVGAIDDTDTTHSNDHEVTQKKEPAKKMATESQFATIKTVNEKLKGKDNVLHESISQWLKKGHENATFDAAAQTLTHITNRLKELSNE